MTGAGKIPADGPARAAYFAELANRRWGAVDRPAPKDGRRRSFPRGSIEEHTMLERAAEIGLERGKAESQTSWDHRIYRLAADEAARAASEATASASGPEALILHLEAEARRYRARARRDRQIADRHDRMADEAESALAAALRRAGRTS